jgi:copper(I)-binding protein
MLGTFSTPGTGHEPAGRRAPARARTGAAARVAAASVVAAGVFPASAAALAGLVGCATRPAESRPIQFGTTYVAQPNAAGTTDAYVVIRNNGSADRLISARSSAGGRVSLRGPSGRGLTTMRTIRGIGIPAGALVRLTPDGFHLLITGSGPMRTGTEITLTLVFARAGPISVAAPVENPQTGGSSYLGG